MRAQTKKIWLLVVFHLHVVSQVLCRVDNYGYNLINGALCIQSPYVKTYTVRMPMDMSCAILCTFTVNCQAFSTDSGACQLFVFSKCSKNVRDCSCSRRGQVFVKQQPGLEPGALCPLDYGDTICGVKYKLYMGSQNWYQWKAVCDADGPLTIFADVTNNDEVTLMDTLFDRVYQYFFLGGFQTPRSREPGSGFNWVACNIKFNASYWAPGDPSDYGPTGENVIGKYYTSPGVVDFYESEPTIAGALCECLSPFD